MTQETVAGEERALFGNHRMEKWEHLLANQLLGFKEMRSCTYRTGIIRERGRLIKGRNIHVFSGNFQKLGYLGKW
jgi:hypothetical protein